MTDIEGVIQYQLEFEAGEIPPDLDCRPLFQWFERCRASGLIGQDPARYDGFAYGNISLRATRGFVISGTQTGGRSELTRADLAWVTDFDAAHNRLRASGPARPSSEAMTHGQLYQALPWANAVIHAHCTPIWQHAAALGLPLTARAAGYGTPQMAEEVQRLVRAMPAHAPGVLVMGGHDDGVIAFGSDMHGAGTALLDTLIRARSLPGAVSDRGAG